MLARQPEVQSAPATFMPPPGTSLDQAEAAPPEAPDAKAENAAIKSEIPTSSQTSSQEFEAAAPALPAPPEDMLRAAAATPHIPAPSLMHIPAIVMKFAPAKVLFGMAKEPAKMATRSIGFYAKGCLAGAKPLPVNGPAWQAMRLSRNRMWGHPSLVRYIERFAKDAKAKDGWPGLLVGDMSMPRGGPMPFGHASHQVGLDVDIWYKPMPERNLTAAERESMPMESFLIDPAHVNPNVWTPDFAKLLRRAVSYPEVARVFVNPAIKKWLCDNVKEDRRFLHKITPIMGHDDHFHVRLVCPWDNPGCRNQAAIPADEGCGKGLDNWIVKLAKATVPATPKPAAASARPAKPKTGITLGQLPHECEAVLKAPSLVLAR
jgi:penicillin-insensitive murein endopeptidase